MADEELDATSPRLAAAGDADEAERLRTQLKWMTFVRVVVVGSLVGTTALLEPRTLDPSASPSGTDAFLLTLGSVLSGLSLAYLAALRFLTSARHLTWLAYAQLVGDACFAAALVFITGGTASAFSFLFMVTIIVAAVLVYRRGAFLAASACAILFVFIGIGELTGVTALGDANELRLEGAPMPQSRGEGVPAAHIGSMAYRLLNNVLAFYAVAFLASHLAERLRRTGQQLEEKSESLEHLQVLHENIVGSIPTGLVTLDLAGRMTFFNPMAAELLELPEHAVGRSTAEVAPALADILERQDQPDGGFDGNSITTRLASDSAIHIEWHVSPLMDAHQSSIGRLVIFQDVTEVRDLAEQIRQAEQFAAIGKLAASIAHEIRNPLTSISGAIQLLAAPDSGLGEPERQQLMAIVGRETDALNGWITDFLAYARPASGEPVEVELARMVGDSVEVLRLDPENANIQFETELLEHASVVADGLRLKQVVWNLLRNGVEAMPQGGTLRVLLTRSVDGWYLLEVRDSGAGIEPGVRERIFEPFFTTKARGTGLGLATAYRVVSEHGGNIWFESEVGAGTAFRVRLPSVTAKLGRARRATPWPSMAAAGRKPRQPV